jgi:acid phosphatase class B
MIVGFDYWQVLSHYPSEFNQLIDALRRDHHALHVVSALGKTRAGTVKKELEGLGFDTEFIQVHEVIFDSPIQSPELKVKKCLELGIDMFYDDRADVCRALRTAGILAVQVIRKDNSTYDLEGDRKMAS